MTGKRFGMYQNTLYDDGNILNSFNAMKLLNHFDKENTKLKQENEQLKEALKNSYMNEICENCKYGNYCLSDNYYGGFEGDFECLKKHFGNDHWKCDGLTECDEFELEIKGDVE